MVGGREGECAWEQIEYRRFQAGAGATGGERAAALAHELALRFSEGECAWEQIEYRRFQVRESGGDDELVALDLEDARGTGELAVGGELGGAAGAVVELGAGERGAHGRARIGPGRGLAAGAREQPGGVVGLGGDGAWGAAGA